jgi:hypothetical protein
MLMLYTVYNLRLHLNREGERNGAFKLNVLTYGFAVANPKSGSDFSRFVRKYIYIYIFFFSILLVLTP